MKNPAAFGTSKKRGFNGDEKATKVVASIAANAGLYNALIAAGLVWSIIAKNGALPLKVFFLSCVAVAGVFGAATLNAVPFVVQTPPALIAAFLVWYANRPA